MSTSSCPCCSDQRIWAAVEELLKPHCLEMQYCPVCGQSAAVREFLRIMHARIIAAIPDIVLDENGNPMYLDRSPWPTQEAEPTQTPLSYKIDMDNINISKEIELIEKYKQQKNT